MTSSFRQWHQFRWARNSTNISKY